MNEKNEILEMSVKSKEQLQIKQKKEYKIYYIFLLIKEKIQQTIDLTFKIILIPIEKIKIITSKPLVKTIISTTTTLSLFSVCVYSLGYLPYQHLTQSKTLRFH